MDDREKQQELLKLQEELKTTGMSRRKFLDRLKALGIGFGAAAVVGAEAAQAHTGDAVSLQSTNAALGNIIDEGREQAAGEPNMQVAQYWRYRRWSYRRWYRRYRRFYRRYRRYYYRRYYW
ncbi:MAG: hypothetical protein AB7F96_02935 [Beijerinckiaceae bacterium]